MSTKERKQIVLLKRRLKESATLSVALAMLVHRGVANHKGEFEGCDVPMCRWAHSLADGEVLDAAAAFDESRQAYEAEIDKLTVLVERWRQDAQRHYARLDELAKYGEAQVGIAQAFKAEADRLRQENDRQENELQQIRWIIETENEFGRSIDFDSQMGPVAGEIHGIIGEKEQRIDQLEESLTWIRNATHAIKGNKLIEVIHEKAAETLFGEPEEKAKGGDK